MSTEKFKVKDFVVCRYNGESGDVIAGQVTGVSKGKIQMKNLLTGADSERATDIVKRRNVVVPRKVAMAVVGIFEETQDKQKARKAAVEAANALKGDDEPKKAKKKVGRPPKAKTEEPKKAAKVNGEKKRRGRPPKNGEGKTVKVQDLQDAFIKTLKKFEGAKIVN